MLTFSIIVPVYNTAHYLAQCLDSIATQTCPDFEVIIVDDGSTDNSASVCKSFAERDSRFNYYYQENSGVSRARNFGIDKAKGEYVFFVDSDDYLSSDCLETFMGICPKADITFFGAWQFDEKGGKECKVASPAYSIERKGVEELIYTLKCGKQGDVFGWTWDKILRNDMLKKYNVRFREDVSFREDELFAFDYCRHISSLRIIDKPLYHYRMRTGGLTAIGMKPKDLLPSSIELEDSLRFYSHPALCEHILWSVTDYRAKDIYHSPLTEMHRKFTDYIELAQRCPQPGVECRVNNLTRYIKKGKWLGWLYCLLRRI